MKPNFDEWAVKLWSNHGPRCENVKIALEQAWEQGYQEAVKTDWWKEQDSNIKTKTTYHGTHCVCSICCPNG